MRIQPRLLVGLAAVFLVPTVVPAESISGLWDATVIVSGNEIPFRMEFSGDGGSVKGSFFDGETKLTSTSGNLENGTLWLRFDYYGSRLDAQLVNGELDGKYDRRTRGLYPFHAKRFVPAPQPEGKIPNIAGVWDLRSENGPVDSKASRGGLTWQLIARQSGAEVTGAVQRIDGDTGALSGVYRDGKFRLSHFSGARPAVFEVTPNEDGTLKIVNGKLVFTAVRSSQARANGIPEPADPTRFTSVKDPTEPFRFRFPDLTGQMVSESDPRFRGKVVIVTVSGSWCPNCHDETPFLVELYRKYKSRGLEIVALSFEEAEQLQHLSRLKAFIEKYGVTFPVLVAGEPAQADEKLPQAVNFGAFPTSFYLGRDGRVRSVHAGFASKATGELHRQLKEETTALVEKLLSEKNASD